MKLVTVVVVKTGTNELIEAYNKTEYGLALLNLA
jgi:hypothetical protein